MSDQPSPEGKHRGALPQRLLPALERDRVHERRFKAAIVVLTGLVVLALLAAMPIGRFASLSLGRRLKWAALGTLGFEPSRAEIDADSRVRRERAIDRTRETYRDFFVRGASPDLQRVLRAARMTPDEVLLRWAN